MRIIPAVDMKDGKVVRLTQGRMAEATVYFDSVSEAAKSWADQGATRLHLVDLNGAFEGRPIHFDAVAAIARELPHVKIQVGGGLRDLDTVRRYFDSGVTYCILGTAAVKNPEFARVACEDYPGRVILGVDAREGLVAVDGWDKNSSMTAKDVLGRFKDVDLESVIYTDVARDGMMGGMDVAGVKTVRDLNFRVIASGGLSSLEDIDALKDLGGVYGVIAGKALYEKRFTLKQALARAAC